MYKHSIKRIYAYCRWFNKYPPDDWCVFGINIWWHSNDLVRYSLCLFGFELRININRKFINQ